jgi:hypothetical protein
MCDFKIFYVVVCIGVLSPAETKTLRGAILKSRILPTLLMIVSLPICTGVDAANFKIIPLGAVHRVTSNAPGLNSTIWDARAAVFDEYSGQTFYCVVMLEGSPADLKKNIKCVQEFSPAQAGFQFDASAAVATPISGQRSDRETIGPWFPSPIWRMQRSDISTLKLCGFTEDYAKCTVGVDLK